MSTNIAGVKLWLVRQVEAAKVAWTVVVVIAGLWGYKAGLTPIKTDGNVQNIIEQRLSAIEKALNIDPNVNADLAQKILKLQVDLKASIEELQKQKGVNNKVISAPKTPAINIEQPVVVLEGVPIGKTIIEQKQK